MKIKVDEISSVITEEIKQYQREIDVAEVGKVLEVGDGIAQIYGLQNALAGELVEFENGEMGQILNLEESSVGVVVLGDYLEISEGEEVRRTGELLSVPVGEALAFDTTWDGYDLIGDFLRRVTVRSAGSGD